MSKVLKKDERLAKIKDDHRQILEMVRDSIRENGANFVDGIQNVLEAIEYDEKQIKKYEVLSKAKEIIEGLIEKIITCDSLEDVYKIRNSLNYYINKIKKEIVSRNLDADLIDKYQSQALYLRKEIAKSVRVLKRQENIETIEQLIHDEVLSEDDKALLRKKLRNEMRYNRNFLHPSAPSKRKSADVSKKKADEIRVGESLPEASLAAEELSSTLPSTDDLGDILDNSYQAKTPSYLGGMVAVLGGLTIAEQSEPIKDLFEDSYQADGSLETIEPLVIEPAKAGSSEPIAEETDQTRTIGVDELGIVLNRPKSTNIITPAVTGEQPVSNSTILETIASVSQNGKQPITVGVDEFGITFKKAETIEPVVIVGQPDSLGTEAKSIGLKLDEPDEAQMSDDKKDDKKIELPETLGVDDKTGIIEPIKIEVPEPVELEQPRVVGIDELGIVFNRPKLSEPVDPIVPGKVDLSEEESLDEIVSSIAAMFEDRPQEKSSTQSGKPLTPEEAFKALHRDQETSENTPFFTPLSEQIVFSKSEKDIEIPRSVLFDYKTYSNDDEYLQDTIESYSSSFRITPIVEYDKSFFRNIRRFFSNLPIYHSNQRSVREMIKVRNCGITGGPALAGFISYTRRRNTIKNGLKTIFSRTYFNSFMGQCLNNHEMCIEWIKTYCQEHEYELSYFRTPEGRTLHI